MRDRAPSPTAKEGAEATRGVWLAVQRPALLGIALFIREQAASCSTARKVNQPLTLSNNDR
jgi:hypothetical protein